MSNVLPKLNATPSHELTIPSTKQVINYRPYLVKEEKYFFLHSSQKTKRLHLRQ